jgi:uridine phosphorylase
MSLPNVPAKVFSFSAVVVGYLLIDDLTTNEQNALGNWLMLTAQVLCTNAFYKQVEQERNTNKTPNKEETISMMEKMIKAMQEELNNLKS